MIPIKTKGKRKIELLPSAKEQSEANRQSIDNLTPNEKLERDVIRKEFQDKYQERYEPEKQKRVDSRKARRKRRAEEHHAKRQSLKVLKNAGLIGGNTREQAKSACVAWKGRFYSLSRWRSLRKRALNLYGNKCHKCGSIHKIHVDHIKCRKYFPELAFHLTNLQILCESCNTSKGTSHSTDYRPKRHIILAEEAVFK